MFDYVSCNVISERVVSFSMYYSTRGPHIRWNDTSLCCRKLSKRDSETPIQKLECILASKSPSLVIGNIKATSKNSQKFVRLSICQLAASLKTDMLWDLVVLETKSVNDYYLDHATSVILC